MRISALRESPQAFLGTFEEESLLHEDDWLKSFESASWHGFFINSIIVGIAKSSILSRHPEERYVESFWVNPRYRNCHVGRGILQHILEEAKNEHRAVIRLSVLRNNQAAVEIFYRWGFSDAEERSSHYEICLELMVDREQRLAASPPVPPLGRQHALGLAHLNSDDHVDTAVRSGRMSSGITNSGSPWYTRTL
jgi:ribosomal protein S18 acetylase RimI-like enzyme